MKILLVEDEKSISEALMVLLQRNGYSVKTVADGVLGLQEAESGIYDVIILDVMLPGISGLQILKELRKRDLYTPVIMLTALSEVHDKVKGLDTGADDYLPKPFNTEELLARIRALIRRKNPEIAESTGLKYLDIELNMKTMRLMCGVVYSELTAKEAQLIEYLILNHDIILSKEKIIEKVWSFDSEATDNHVEVYISFLRKKLSYLESQVKIQTIRGAGYKLCSEN